MKIRKIKWKNHSILGNLELDFLNNERKISNTIIFAGENGTGKTTILEALANYIIDGSIQKLEYLEYELMQDIYKVTFVNPTHRPSQPYEYDIYKYTRDRWNIVVGKAEIDKVAPKESGCVYSKARANFTTEQIQSPKSSQLDTSNKSLDENEDFTPLKQLLVDIDASDKDNYYNQNKGLGDLPKSINQFYPTSKAYRFKNAFDNFFINMKYEGINDRQNQKEVIFKKNGVDIALEKLSTGEKQIVFRGTSILRNNLKLNDSIILIDEPELSMHPKWERKILQYFKDISTNGNTHQAQIFFSTHSEHIIKEALLNKDDNLVIVLNCEANIIEAKKIDHPSVLPTITNAETNYMAFDIISNDYHIELYGWIQDHEDKRSVKQCDSYLTESEYYNQLIHEKLSLHGSTQYTSLPTYIRNAIHHPDNGNTFTEEELRTSIEFMITICQSF